MLLPSCEYWNVIVSFEKGPLERFRQPRLFGSSLVPFLGSSMQKIEKRLLNSFGANGLQVQKEPNLTLPTLKNDL